MRPLLPLAFVCAAGCAGSPPAPSRPPSSTPPPQELTLGGLREGVATRGFVAEALYVDDRGTPRGARFVHARTHFVFDYLHVESAPQAMVWVTTYPSSDGGEPHTQEHLLLGRGNKGRALGNFDHANLAIASAFTAQYRTAYAFHTMSGESAFWPLLETHLDSLLHPDYSDEEIRREVRDFGVAKGPDGLFAVTEKGTVYNEMVNRFDDPAERNWYALERLVYGPGHPLANVAGGTPEGIRELTPAKIRMFHAAHYRLENMGMVAAFPSSVALGTALDRVGGTLDALAASVVPVATGTTPVPITEATLPSPRGAKSGELQVVDYPSATTDHPGQMRFAWPPSPKGDPGEIAAMNAFLGAFGGGAGSTLYSALVDRTTRELDTGATDVWCGSINDPGYPVHFGLENVGASHGDEATLRAVRALVHARLTAVAALPDGSKELAAFQERYKARLIDDQRWIDKFLDTPPGFGARSTGDGWIMHLSRNVNVQPGFRRSLSLEKAFAYAMALGDGGKNPWRERIGRWGLLEEPYGVVARPSPALRAALDGARKAREDAEVARLVAVYALTDAASDAGSARTVGAQAALARCAKEIAAADAELTRAEAAAGPAPFMTAPPMTQDDGLAWKAGTVRGVPIVATTFETMKSATVGLALRLDAIPEALLPYVAQLASLMRDVGVIRDGTPIPYDQVRDRLRREVLAVDVGIQVSFTRKRAELVLEASGNDEAETRRALAWMRDFLTTPDWRPENLPRIRDVVNERMKQDHDVLASPEEYWAQRAAYAYFRQDAPLLMHAGSFLTRAHDALRLSYLLEDPAIAKELGPFVRALGDAGKKADRASLGRLAAGLAGADVTKLPPPLAKQVKAARALPKGAQPLVEKVGHDLGEFLADVPDESLAADWATLTGQMADDLARPPAETLAALGAALAAVRHANLARAWVVGSAHHQEAIRADVDALVGALDPSPAAAVAYATTPRVDARARARGAVPGAAPLAALVDRGKSNASLLHSTPGASYEEPTEAALVDYLAGNVFNGSGGHSLYKRIWGAGLAYSGYAWTSAGEARFALYSDRCADLAGLLRFVDGEVRRAPSGARIVDYVVTTAFGSRVGDTYEGRASAIAYDVAYGETPERVRAFRTRLLALREQAGIAERVNSRVLPVYGALLPSLVPGAPRPVGSLFFAIGPEGHVAAYERELAASMGSGTKVLRLYPRDFW